MEKVSIEVSKETAEMLTKITDRYNEKVNEHYMAGDLDFIPKDNSEEEMLEVIMSIYVMEHMRELIEIEENEQ